MAAVSPEDDPKRLRKEIAELKQKLELTEDLVRLLREFPENRLSPATEPERSVRGSASRETKKTPTRGKKTRRASSSRAQAEDRPGPLGEPPSPSAR